jgi:uncharacterized lipoprotein YmbA
MKRASVLPASCLFVLSLLLGGCTTYDEQTTHGANLPAKKHYFVQSNLNDNHAIAEQIDAVLKQRGFEGDNGPLTMMPDDTQVLITYQDSWAWDFGDHLVYLQISAMDRRTGGLLAAASFKAKIPPHKTVAKIIGELVDRMYAEYQNKKKS